MAYLQINYLLILMVLTLTISILQNLTIANKCMIYCISVSGLNEKGANC